MKKVNIVGTNINLIRKQWKPYATIEIQGPGVKKIIKNGTSIKKYETVPR